MRTKRSLVALLSIGVLLAGAGCAQTIPEQNSNNDPSVTQPENSVTTTAVSEVPAVPAPADPGSQISDSNGVENNIKVSPPRARGEDSEESENETESSDDDGGRVTPPVATPPVSVVPAPTPAPTPSPTPAPAPAPSTPSYTMAQVALANSASKCWSAINGNVYDLTSWVNMHPGGASAILSLCGIDGTQAYSAMHGSQPRPANELSSLKIGVLK
jgi:cytochrome b involved in lipid metabolism